MAKNCGADVPSEFTCIDYIDQASGAIDVITGGDNGYVYLWRSCQCVRAFAVMPGHIPGPVLSLRVHGSMICAVGSKGVVKLIDCSTMETQEEYSTLTIAPRGGGGGGQVIRVKKIFISTNVLFFKLQLAFLAFFAYVQHMSLC